MPSIINMKSILTVKTKKKHLLIAQIVDTVNSIKKYFKKPLKCLKNCQTNARQKTLLALLTLTQFAHCLFICLFGKLGLAGALKLCKTAAAAVLRNLDHTHTRTSTSTTQPHIYTVDSRH